MTKNNGHSPARILFFANTDWYLYNFRSALMEAAANDGYRVSCISPPGPFGEKLKAAGFDWRPLPFARDSRTGMLLSLWRTRRALKQLILDARPDVIHSFTLTSILLTWLACPGRLEVHRVNAVTGLGYAFTGRSLVHRVLQAVLRPFMRRALGGRGAVTVVQNETDRAFLCRQFGLSSDSVRLIASSGVDINRFKPATGRNDDRMRIGFVGRLLEDKGIREFVSAARRVAERSSRVAFVAAGVPDAGNPAAIGKHELARWQAEGLVEFVGQVDDMPGFLAGLDVFVLPSYREGLSRSLIEAGASGLPAVTTDVPGCRDVVEEGHNGLLIPPRDADALAQAIETVVEDTELRRRMGTHARERVEAKFANEMVSDATLSLYDELLTAP